MRGRKNEVDYGDSGDDFSSLPVELGYCSTTGSDLSESSRSCATAAIRVSTNRGPTHVLLQDAIRYAIRLSLSILVQPILRSLQLVLPVSWATRVQFPVWTITQKVASVDTGHRLFAYRSAIQKTVTWKIMQLGARLSRK